MQIYYDLLNQLDFVSNCIWKYILTTIYVERIFFLANLFCPEKGGLWVARRGNLKEIYFFVDTVFLIDSKLY